MKFKGLLRIFAITAASIAAVLIIFIVIAVSRIDRNIDYNALADTMQLRIAAVDQPLVIAHGRFKVGYSKVNLTPSSPRATAGYGKRLGKLYKSVHDSIYVRTLVIDNGVERVAIVSADLLIIPPTVTELLKQELASVNFSLDNTYLGATHSHNSIGNWAIGITSLLYGVYEDSIVHFIADKITTSISRASNNMLAATIKIGTVAVREGVYNRVRDDGPVDPLVRMIEIQRSDSTKLLFSSYTAHATCLSSRDLELSGDYPAKLIETLESNGYDFAIFMAGAVGSHGPAAPEGGRACVNWMAETISKKIEAAAFTKMENTFVEMHRVPLALSDPQPKVLPDWRLKPMLFNTAFGQYPTYITVLRIGDIVLLGTPCDFSGEFNASLDSLASTAEVFPIVTSFNGGYIGYLTPEKYYDIDHYETQLMNWYGPGNGEYVKDVLERLLLSVTQ